MPDTPSSTPVFLRLTQHKIVRERQVIAPQPEASPPATSKKKGSKKAPKKKPAARQPVEQWVDRAVVHPVFVLVRGECPVINIEPSGDYGEGSKHQTCVGLAGGQEAYCAESAEAVFAAIARETGARLAVIPGGDTPPALTADGVSLVDSDGGFVSTVYVLEPAAAPTAVVGADANVEARRFDDAARRHMLPLTDGRPVDRDGFRASDDAFPLTLNAAGERPADECFESLDHAYAQLDEIMERRGAGTQHAGPSTQDEPLSRPAGEAALGEGSANDDSPLLLADGADAHAKVGELVYFADDAGWTEGGVLHEIGTGWPTPAPDVVGEPVLRIALSFHASGDPKSCIARRPHQVWSTYEAAEDALSPKRPLAPVLLADGVQAKVGMPVWIEGAEGQAPEPMRVMAIFARATRPLALESRTGTWDQSVRASEAWSTQEGAASQHAAPSPAAAGEAALGEGDSGTPIDAAPCHAAPPRSVVVGDHDVTADTAYAEDPAIARDRAAEPVLAS